MKKGYKRLLIFEIILIILFLLSNFVPSILSNYTKILFIIILLLMFKFLFGFEKDNHRYTKNVCIELIIYLLIYFLLYYLSGIVLSFARTTNYLHFNGLLNVVIPTILLIIFKEILRYMMLRKSEGSKMLIVITCVFFIIFDLIGTFSVNTFYSLYTIFLYIAITLLPIISRNILCTYISYKTGYKPVWLYSLIIGTYSFFLPIIPNPNKYIYSVVELVIPMIYLYFLYKYFKREKDEKVEREYSKKRIGGLIIPSLLVIFLVYFTSGYFYYHAIVIASGSMTPNILKGDVVVIEKIPNKKDIKIGEVIAYKHEDIIVVHRLVKKIIVDGEVFYYTKGDANNGIDKYKITEDEIIGIVNIRIPYIGYPTVWINEL